MLPNPSQRPPVALILVAGLLMVMGSCGVVSGVNMASGAAPPGLAEKTSDPADPTFDPNEALLKVIWLDPMKRGLGAANLVVSLLLLVAASALLARRGSAIWWVTQAVLANTLFTVVQVGRQIFLLHGARDLVEHATEMSKVEAGAPAPDPEAVLVVGYLALLVGGLLRIVPYVWALARVRRADVREALAQDP